MRKRSRMDNELLATAYHEAGHAVIAEVLGIHTKGASVVPNTEQQTLGHVLTASFPKSFRPDFEITASMIDLLMRRIMVCLAGYFAEEKFTGNKETDGAASDHARAVDLACYVTSSIEETDAYIAWLEIRTNQKVELYYSTIEALAKALYEQKTMTGNQVREIIRVSAFAPIP